MLNGIKALINGKIALQESASIILENSSSMDLDDAIVLGEDGELDLPEVEEGADDDIKDPTSEDNQDMPEDKDEPEGLPTEDGSDTNIEDPTTDDSSDVPNEDPMDTSIDELPTPVGKQTGEPVIGDDDDIMSMDINLNSNTISNALPIPPSNAGEAIASDEISTQRVDSGFGGEGEDQQNTSDPVGESADNSSEKCNKLSRKTIKDQLEEILDEFDVKVFLDKETGGVSVKVFDEKSETRKKIKKLICDYASSNGLDCKEVKDDSKLYFQLTCKGDCKKKDIKESVMTEGISLAGGMEGDATTDPTGDPAPVDDAAASPTPDASGEGENSVTAAVRDKVNEAESIDGTTDDGPTTGASMSKEDILKKLSGITKNLEDVKKVLIG